MCTCGSSRQATIRSRLSVNSHHDRPSGHSIALLELFPECKAWDKLRLDEHKKKLTGGQSLPTAARGNLSQWLALSHVHVFVRPLLGNIVFVDLDDFFKRNKNLDQDS